MQHASPARATARQTVVVLVAALLLPLLLKQCVSSAAPEVQKTAAAPAAVPSPLARKPLRILALMTFDTMSHHIWMSALTVELAKRGHLVTSIDIHKHGENPPTLNTTIIETAFKVFDDPEDRKRWFAASVVKEIGMMQSLLEEDCKRDLECVRIQPPTEHRPVGGRAVGRRAAGREPLQAAMPTANHEVLSLGMVADRDYPRGGPAEDPRRSPA